MKWNQQQLESALLAADQAGNEDDARFLAQELHNLRQQNQGDILTHNVDYDRGAPASVRLSVAQSPKEDKLASLQKFYPDARSYKDDNFIYTDPETNRQTVYNPKGFDAGDLVEYSRLGAEVAGGIAGGIAGGAAGSAIPIAGTAAGALGGSSIGAEVAGQGFDWIARKLLPIVDNRTPFETLGDAAINTGINFIGGKAGELAGGLLSKFGGTLRRGTGVSNEAVVEAGERVGVDLPLGVASSNKTIQKMEETLAAIPTSSGTIGEAYAKTLDAMGKFALDESRKIADAEGAYDVGSSVLSGINTHTAKFKEDASKLYNELWEAMPKDTRIPLDNTKNALDAIDSKFIDDPAFKEILGSKKLSQFKKAIDASGENGVSVGTLKALRTQIGSQMENANLIDDAASAEIKQIYGALSDDLEVASMVSGDIAHSKWMEANDFYKSGMEVIDNVLNPLAKSGIAETTYKRIFGAEGQVLKNPNVEEIKTLLKAMPAKQRGDIEGEFLRRMGLARSGSQDVTGEVFSPASFMTNYNRMSQQAKDAVFSDSSKQALDDLAVLSASLKDRASVANSSGTAAPIIQTTILIDAMSGMSGGATALAGAGYGAGKLMTSPKFVKWLTKTSESESRSEFTKRLGSLAAMAENDTTLRPAIYDFFSSLNQVAPEVVEPVDSTLPNKGGFRELDEGEKDIERMVGGSTVRM